MLLPKLHAFLAHLVVYRSAQGVAGSIPSLANFFPNIDDSLCGRINASFTADYCFNDNHVGKQPVV